MKNICFANLKILSQSQNLKVLFYLSIVRNRRVQKWYLWIVQIIENILKKIVMCIKMITEIILKQNYSNKWYLKRLQNILKWLSVRNV